MQETAIMEQFKWYTALIIAMMLLSLAIFFYHVNNVNSFKQHVSYQIERQGGLTETAVESIENYSETYYGGRFEVKSDQLNQKVDYGTTVDYTVVGTFDIKLFNIPPIKWNFEGSGVSLVR